MANRADTDQTAPLGAVGSRSTLFAQMSVQIFRVNIVCE